MATNGAKSHRAAKMCWPGKTRHMFPVDLSVSHKIVLYKDYCPLSFNTSHILAKL